MSSNSVYIGWVTTHFALLPIAQDARETSDFGNAHHPISASISYKTVVGKNIKK